MPELEAIETELEAARAELCAAAADLAPDEFTAQPIEAATGDENVRDLLWRAGYLEDWRRRVIKQGLDGEPAPPLEHRQRPAHLETPEILRAWIDQTRRPVLSLLRRMSDADLDRSITLDGGASTPREQLLAIVKQDREHATLIRAVRAAAGGTSAAG